MENSIISEGKTTNEAIEKGLKQLNVTKDMVNIKVLEEEKRSFFSILAPRVVKVEITLKENAERKDKRNTRKEEETHHEYTPKKLNLTEEEKTEVVEQINQFLKEFFHHLGRDDIKYQVEIQEYNLFVTMNGEKLNYLIGYRGETLNALQVILTSIASKYSKDRLKVLVDIENYRQKREKSLEELAEKISKTVVKTGKSITLEPMSSFERKIIHSKLQNSNEVKTYSIGVEPYRKVVVALK